MILLSLTDLEYFNVTTAVPNGILDEDFVDSAAMGLAFAHQAWTAVRSTNATEEFQVESFGYSINCLKIRHRIQTSGGVWGLKLSLQQAALGLSQRFCLFLLGSSPGSFFLAWLHSSCSMPLTAYGTLRITFDKTLRHT